jgi:hypothetical protein
MALVLFWYGLVPVAGAFISRRFWRIFRNRFDNLCLAPPLDYAAYCRGGNGTYRIIGGVESVTDGHILWVRSPELTVPVVLTGAQIYVLPMPGDDADSFDPGREIPERIRWDRVSALTSGAKVFVGGALVSLKDRRTFVSLKGSPLLVIFYDGPDRSLTARAIRAGRHRNEYWNPITPHALLLGAISNLIIAVSFLSRPAFRLTVITAFIAIFTPLFPLLPPGVLLTVLYRRLWWRARIYRAYRDLARLPLKYLSGDGQTGQLPGGESYGYVCYESLSRLERPPPLLIPGEQPRKGAGWYVFGTFSGTPDTPPGLGEFPREPQDILAVYGAIPGKPEVLARGYTIRAYVLEIISWLILLGAIGLNVLFTGMIVYLLWK